MHTTYRLKADDLDERFVNSLRALFGNKEIEIIVREHDETEYLLGSTANRERLLRAVADVERGENIVVPEQEQFR